MKQTTAQMVADIYQPRLADARKYDHGLVVVIGGSELYSGSPALSALSAFRSGADMVKIVAPQRAADIIASFTPDFVALGLPGPRLCRKHLADIIALTESSKEVARGHVAAVIGGGVGRTQDTRQVVQEFLKQTTLPVVVDADAIYALTADVVRDRNFLITPHYFEFFSLTGREVYNLSEDEKIQAVQEEAYRLKTTILLKGEVDICSDGNEVIVNRTGSPYLAVGGCGDVLAGICGSLMARGVSALEAGAVAAYLNGRVGERFGNESMMATDVINYIGTIIKEEVNR